MKTFTATVAQFETLTAQLKEITTRKRIAKSVLGSRHPVVNDLRHEQRLLRNERRALGLVFLGQAGSKADLVVASGVDEGAYVEELLQLALGAEGEEE